MAFTADQANAIVARTLASVTVAIAYHGTDDETDTTIDVDAVVGPWRIVRGGRADASVG
ncbi:MAG TPA: hypothetical protein VFB89_03145 [Gemmatimonadales bacterium]|nr:hypothetical protein [Gemmatimonadales bacterium]